MKKRILFLTFLFSVSFCFSQTVFDTETKDSTNIYYHSLKKMCEIVGHSVADNKTIYVEKNLFTDNLPAKVLDYNIEYLNPAEQIEIIKKKDGKMFLIRIVPLRIRKGIFSVNVIPFHASYHKKHFELANGGGLKAEYKFDTVLNGLVFEKAHFNGI